MILIDEPQAVASQVDAIVTEPATLRQQLHAAIDLAQNPGKCSYKAGCIVGKMFDLIDFRVPEESDGTDPSGFNHPLAEIRTVLQELQTLWDEPLADDETLECRKHEAHELLDGLAIKKLDRPLSQ